MMHMTNDTRILIAVAPADFRKGIDGFVALCRQALGQDPRSGTRFVFTNRSRTMVRVLTYDGTGFWLMTKRLSKGRFRAWPSAGQPVSAATAKALSLWLKGPGLAHPGQETVKAA
jgi:transposase